MVNRWKIQLVCSSCVSAISKCWFLWDKDGRTRVVCGDRICASWCRIFVGKVEFMRRWSQKRDDVRRLRNEIFRHYTALARFVFGVSGELAVLGRPRTALSSHLDVTQVEAVNSIQCIICLIKTIIKVFCRHKDN